MMLAPRLTNVLATASAVPQADAGHRRDQKLVVAG